MVATSSTVIPLLLLLIQYTATVSAALPTELDPFLEKLFEFSECEDFVSSSDWVSVATRDCSPHVCDFPRQLCQRPAGKFRDSSANQCKYIPEECVTAANGGVPLPVATKSPFSLITPPPLFPITQTKSTESSGASVAVDNLCELDAPVGRFCGFLRKWTYNRETGQCDQFWFPGCKTRETNANLFDTQALCNELALLCREKVLTTTTTSAPSTFPPLPMGFSPFTLAPLPQPQFTTPWPRALRPQPPPSNFLPRPIGGQGGEGGGASSGGPGPDIFGQQAGNGEFGNNIVSLLANTLMGGRGGRGPAIQGGQQSKTAQALSLVSQFTNFEFGNLPSLLGGGR